MYKYKKQFIIVMKVPKLLQTRTVTTRTRHGNNTTLNLHIFIETLPENYQASYSLFKCLFVVDNIGILYLIISETACP